MKISSVRRLASALIAAMIFSVAGADIPAGYYDKASGLATERLKNALHAIIGPHQKVSSYSALPSYFEKTDVRPGTNLWWDMYSDIEVPTNITFGKYMNREHAFPKSWWGGSTSVGAYTDLFHLYPAEAKANQAKSNYPLGIVTGTPNFDNDVVKVGNGVESGGAKLVFEPADEYKGDFARTYFYVVTAYQNLSWKYTYMAADGDYPSLQPWAIEMLLKWHRDDPVSEKELKRNEVVYSIQTNRNPFIDYPELAEYIWGNRMGQTFVPDDNPGPSGDPELTSPVAGATIEFGRVAIDHKSQYSLLFKGANLSGMLELTVIGADRNAFTLSQTTVDAASANSPSGASVIITYNPSSTGLHEASLVVQDGGLAGSLSFPIKGECVPVPSLVAPEALPAVMLADRRYEASWNQPEGGDPVDFWNIYVTSYYSDDTFKETVYVAEESPFEIEADPEAVSESYTVTAVALGCESARSNSINVDVTGGIDAPSADSSPLSIETDGLTLTFICGTSHRNLRVIDPMGRIVAVCPEIHSGDTMTLPSAGIYIIVADTCQSPIRIIAR
ncbi:MAG: ribonuclease [Muribaculaceae bacterium]|nr:ribonuclease [Muribaculaceae bacterium]